ncbi:MerR family transcriptional regulator [Commensalibacter oyaizuii]|uniref:MerR family transcriptional regulator n=1 Tax=Commensalibacter oyaizuii TaxID=3043873 RepID=A0ABT6PZY4_9PROT|nr:MerR family transcriptional regulator [Commensalibacter sp. TBRC 16381]MDI2090413.1 MerR family transcriptional regulator [Commensalibacter sp. TBRC 16381]
MTGGTFDVSSDESEDKFLNTVEEDDSNLEDDNVIKKDPGAFRTISEVAEEIQVPQHVLRFWETRFTQVQPVKRSGGRRYYRAEDITLLKYISELLYVDGYTIKGVQRLLDEDFSKFTRKEEQISSSETSAETTHNEDKIAPVCNDVEATTSSSTDNSTALNTSPLDNFQNLDSSSSEIHLLQEKNAYLVDSLRSILVELHELRKIIADS